MTSIGKNFPLAQLGQSVRPSLLMQDMGSLLPSGAGAKGPDFAKTLESLESVAPSTSKFEEAQAVKAATQFEALLLQQMLQAMWSTIPKDGALAPSRDEETFREMLHQGLANDIAEGQGIGIKSVILKEFEARSGSKQAS